MLISKLDILNPTTGKGDCGFTTWIEPQINMLLELVGPWNPTISHSYAFLLWRRKRSEVWGWYPGTQSQTLLYEVCSHYYALPKCQHNICVVLIQISNSIKIVYPNYCFAGQQSSTMPVHQHGDGSSFNVYGNYYDYGTQINAPMGDPGTNSRLLSWSNGILYRFDDLQWMLSRRPDTYMYLRSRLVQDLQVKRCTSTRWGSTSLHRFEAAQEGDAFFFMEWEVWVKHN